MDFCIYSQQCLVVSFHKEVYSLHTTEIPSAESSHCLVTGNVLDSFPVEAKLIQSACLPFFFFDILIKFRAIQRRVEFIKILKFL